MPNPRAKRPSLRRCVVCRASLAKAELYRFVFEDGQLSFDEEMKKAGRGVYLHKRAECLLAMCDARRWERSLRLNAGSVRAETIAVLMRELSSRVLDF